VIASASIGLTDLAIMLLRDGSPVRWHALDWAAGAVLLAAALVAARPEARRPAPGPGGSGDS
jgi:hypothetical protein